MFYTSKEDSSSLEEINVDKKTFYRKRVKAQHRKKRYSEQFKDPLFIQKDINRKLKMIERFRQNVGDIKEKTDKYKECINKCLNILNSELEVPIKTMFECFALGKYGFKLEDYGIDEDSNETDIRSG